jgi:ribA/ribD-fused uncharacterized protein
MNFYSVAPFIQQYYPEYYSIETYPADKCVCIRKVTDEWGILGNFARTRIKIKNVELKNSEQLFQLMKFIDEEPVRAVYQAANPKYTAKHWEKMHRRSDWGCIIVDAMKFCLLKKYEQSEEFRHALSMTKDLFVVEDQTSFPKKTADTWGVKRIVDNYVGPNLLGRLLMELRDGPMTYSLPDNALKFTDFLNLSERST